MKINGVETRDECRKKYGSVAECCRVYNVSTRLFYLTVAGQRGAGPRADKSKAILDRLIREGLLVEKDETDAA